MTIPRYLLGYFFGASVIYGGIFYLPVLTGDNGGLLMAFIHFLSGIQILRKKTMGWALFVFGVGIILLMKVIIGTLMGMNVKAFWMMYGPWWLYGIFLWILYRKQVT